MGIPKGLRARFVCNKVNSSEVRILREFRRTAWRGRMVRRADALAARVKPFENVTLAIHVAPFDM